MELSHSYGNGIHRLLTIKALLWCLLPCVIANSRASLSRQESEYIPSASSPFTTDTMTTMMQEHRIVMDESGVLGIPLLPHHQVLERYLQEQSQDGVHEGQGIKIPTNSQLPPKRRRRIDNNEPVTSSNQAAALYQGYGTHYIDLWVGTPPQRQTVIVDTGSGVTAFPCLSCAGCGENYHTDKYFDQDNSSTFESLSCNECFRGSCRSDHGSKFCHVGVSYQEGSSWDAFEGRDISYVGGPHNKGLVDHRQDGDENHDDDVVRQTDTSVTHVGLNPGRANEFAFPLTFGCQTHLTGLFKTQLADGIMGMDNAPSSFWKQMYNSGKLKSPVFSLCFSKNHVAKRSGSLAGTMTLGGSFKQSFLSPMVYSRITNDSGFYNVYLRKLYLHTGGGERLGGDFADLDVLDGNTIELEVSESSLNRGKVIVDSGTTDTYMNKAVSFAFEKAWNAATGLSFAHIEDVSVAEIRKWPTIIFQMGAASINGDEDYDVQYPEDVPGKAGFLDKDNPDDILVVMPPSHYMEFDEDSKKFYKRISFDEYSGSVLGANFMQGHNVMFDLSNKRIGFAESECNYLDLINGRESQPIDPYGESKIEDASKLTVSTLVIITVSALLTALFIRIVRRKRRTMLYSSAGTDIDMTEEPKRESTTESQLT